MGEIEIKPYSNKPIQYIIMKILFDLQACQPIGHIKFHGGGIYGYIILKKLLEKNPQSLIIYVDCNSYIDPEVEKLINQFNIPIIDASKIKFKDAINESIALVYTPVYSAKLNSILSYNIPIYITIHGMRKLELNRDKYEYLYSNNLKNTIKSYLKQTPIYNLIWKKFYKTFSGVLEHENVNIITVSNHSRSSIYYYYPFITKRINVYYSPSTDNSSLNEIPSYSNEKYYLIISADRWLKNSFRALLAFDRLFASHNLQGKVIVLGLNSQNKLYKRLQHKNKFEIKDYVEKETLESLLKGAFAFIYPSLNEGFGYPPLEAMKYATPVITSGISSIPEVCGDAVLYANPYSEDEIAMRILELEDPSLYKKLQTKSIERYQYIKTKQKNDLEELANLLLSKIQ